VRSFDDRTPVKLSSLGTGCSATGAVSTWTFGAGGGMPAESAAEACEQPAAANASPANTKPSAKVCA
jgi:hypothetical protein